MVREGLLYTKKKLKASLFVPRGMQNREAFKKLRPAIPSIAQENQTSVAEQFQNECLRPILKLQNELLLALFRHYIEKRKGGFHQLPQTGKVSFIEGSIQRDVAFKNLLAGTIIGQFTLEEYRTFQEHERELTRRIASLLIQRFKDQMAEM